MSKEKIPKIPKALVSKENLPPPRLRKKSGVILEQKRTISEPVLDETQKEFDELYRTMENKISTEQRLKKAKFILDILLRERSISLNQTLEEVLGFVQERISELKKTIDATLFTLKEHEKLSRNTGGVKGRDTTEFNNIAREEREKAEREIELLFALEIFLNSLLIGKKAILKDGLWAVERLLRRRLKTIEGEVEKSERDQRSSQNLQ